MESPSTIERRAKFKTLVKRAEQEFAKAPQPYRRRLFLLALLGYLVIGALIATVIALLGGSILLAFFSPFMLVLLIKNKVIIVLGLILYLLIRTLLIRIPPPEGRRITRDHAPALFSEIDNLTDALETPRIDRVLISADLNAYMSQVPRLGPIGLTTNTLILGLPLLMSLTPEQARAVIAHEFGHLSANHARFNGWIYRLRSSWMRVMEAMDANARWSTKWLQRFFDWYAPYFEAYSFALARANEYEADAAAAEITSPEHCSAALVNVHVRAELVLDEYWQGVAKRIKEEPEAPLEPFCDMRQHFQMFQPKSDRLLKRLDDALAARTEQWDTHPSLAD